MMKNEYPQPLRQAGLLFLFTGFLLFALALGYNEVLLTWLDSDPPLAPQTVQTLRVVQTIWFLLGCLFLAISEILRPGALGRFLHRVFQKELSLKIALSLLTFLLPLLVLEMTLRPFVRFKPKHTTVFVKDAKLGWKLRAGVEDYWGGARVRINNKGLRGPDLDYEKPAGCLRILFLGDSVTFGYRLKTYEETFPSLTGQMLSSRTGRHVEAINAGVGGYSIWQELEYLQSEGIKFQPDLAVLSFVLNDVTEKMDLTMFGGTGEGSQLFQSYYSFYDWLCNNSSIAYVIAKIKARAKYGPDIQKGAVQIDTLRVEQLVTDPDNPRIKKAWDLTAKEFKDLAGFCKSRDLPLLAVLFPFVFQLNEPDLPPIPQQRFLEWAEQHQVPVLDLLPLFAEHIKNEGVPVTDIFLDEDHLSPLGSSLAAKWIADFMMDHAAQVLPGLSKGAVGAP